MPHVWNLFGDFITITHEPSTPDIRKGNPPPQKKTCLTLIVHLQSTEVETSNRQYGGAVNLYASASVPRLKLTTSPK